MNDSHSVVFEPFRIDFRDERLWQGGDAIPLTNKAFAVLRYLVQHPARLVTKEVLLEKVWSPTYVTDAALAMCIHELRHALGDNARAPQYIATVRGRGYRFIAPIKTTQQSLNPVQLPRNQSSIAAVYPRTWADSPSPSVGRVTELNRINSWFDKTQRGQRQTVFISGEAGIGKTTLVERFLAQSTMDNDLWVGHGQCIDQHGPGEPYLPVLEALGRLCRGAGDAHLLEVLRQYAPSWVAQMPSLLTVDEFESLQRNLIGATRDRMLRELAEAVEILSMKRPLLLVFEDLHWSDPSTLEWLAYITRRRDPARLFVLATYRPVDAIVRDHVLRKVVQDLKQQTQCTELLLDYLTENDVAAYLAQRVGANSAPNELTRFIYTRSGGNPLFMITIVDTLLKLDSLVIDGDGWRITGELETLAAKMPENLRLLIEQQLEQLNSELQDLLEAASVAGAQFSAAAVAACTSLDVETVDKRFAAMSRHGQFVQSVGTSAWPDGTIGGRYNFIHSLYQEVVYKRVAAGPRVRLHRQIGLRLEAGYDSGAEEIAVELASHFVHGSDPERAVKYLVLSGENALHRGAYQEVIASLTLAIDMLGKLPDTREHLQLELKMQSSLGAALIAAKGYAWRETARTFARARELCGLLGKSEPVSEVLFGICLFHLDRAELNVAREVADEALETAKCENDETGLLLSHRLVGTCLFFLGEFVSARKHLELALDLYRPEQHRHLMLVYATDIRVTILSWLNRVLCLLGYPEQALQRSLEAVNVARELRHPHSLAFALRDACFVHQFLEDVPSVKERAEALISLATQEGFSFELEVGRIHHGWTLAETGSTKDGFAEIEQGLLGYQATGSEFQVPYFLTLLATTQSTNGQNNDALEFIDGAIRRLQKTEERWFEAEIYRLRGEFLIKQDMRHTDQAEVCFQHAMDTARGQQAKALELRATMSLARLWQTQGKRTSALSLLTPVYHWFTEGSHTTDMLAASTLIKSLES